MCFLWMIIEEEPEEITFDHRLILKVGLQLPTELQPHIGKTFYIKSINRTFIPRLSTTYHIETEALILIPLSIGNPIGGYTWQPGSVTFSYPESFIRDYFDVEN